MAAILQSLTRKSARHVFSFVDLRLPPSCQRGRLLHSGNAPVNPSANPAEVDLLVKKVERVAMKTVMIESIESLMKEQKTKIASPYLQGFAKPALVAAATMCFYVCGYRLGFDRKIKDTRNLEQSS